MTQYVNARGYTAKVLVQNPERTIYDSFEKTGEPIQERNCVTTEFFNRNWRKKK